MENNLSTPATSSWFLVNVLCPQNTHTLFLWNIARCNTPSSNLPERLCPSTRPSPVTTKLQPSILPSTSNKSNNNLHPLSSLAFKYNARAYPTPPAAPAPGNEDKSFPDHALETSAKPATPFSNNL